METISADGANQADRWPIERLMCRQVSRRARRYFWLRGYTTNPRYDSLLAKLIVSSPETMEVCDTARAASLREFRIGGPRHERTAVAGRCWRTPTSVPNQVHTTFLEERISRCLPVVQSPLRPINSQRQPGRTRPRGNIDLLSVFDPNSALSVVREERPIIEAMRRAERSSSLTVAGNRRLINVVSGESVRSGSPCW